MSTHSLDSPKGENHFLDNVHDAREAAIVRSQQKSGIVGLLKDKRMLGICMLASLSGFLFGYDQGVVGNVLVLESFGAAYPRIYMNASLKGWWVSTLLLAAWFGSLVNGPLVSMHGRRRNIQFHTITFVLGAALQTGARNEGYLFAGRAIAGFSVGALTHTAPMYIAELAPAHLRGSLVACQQLSITLGILFSYWIAYGTSHIGGTRCAPQIPYTGAILNGNPTFDAYHDVPAGGCTGQSQAAWRIPVGIQILPAIILGVALFWMPYSPRWLVEKGRDDEAKTTLSYLRHASTDSPEVVTEFLEIKADFLIQRELRLIATAGKGGLRAALQPYLDLVTSRSNFHRLYIGCTTMFFQQFIGCNCDFAPTIFAQLGLDPNTSSLLATGVYGITNTVFTLPAVFFIDRVGRRALLLAGAVGCGVSLVIVGSMVAAFAGQWDKHATAGRVAIAFIYVYDVNFSYSWAPIGWVLPSEIFNLSTRATAVSITTSTTWMANFIIGLVSPIMLEKIPHGGTYFFFAAFAAIAFVSTYFTLPETRLKTLEEMDDIFKAESSIREREITAAVRQELGLERSASTKPEKV
ncbi:hypothetical protein BMF94_1217 [Rhodotorula taiwanensis]|uniref:Major facilitator superfamily (MFS) profile domain-containing protein n=1 Tax=Rhodotorula taiwanensis TaxID=741276 RepID=A0A2S5BFQ0_9BASI|nr:hypothetical protein BMF94_1217 [Rhodotorula taiwanensis]